MLCLQQQHTDPSDMQGMELCPAGTRSTLQSKLAFICTAARQFVSLNLRTCVQHPAPLSSSSYADTANHCQSTDSYAQTLCAGAQSQMVTGGKLMLSHVHSVKSSLTFLPSSTTKLNIDLFGESFTEFLDQESAGAYYKEKLKSLLSPVSDNTASLVWCQKEFIFLKMKIMNEMKRSFSCRIAEDCFSYNKIMKSVPFGLLINLF